MKGNLDGRGDSGGTHRLLNDLSVSLYPSSLINCYRSINTTLKEAEFAFLREEKSC